MTYTIRLLAMLISVFSAACALANDPTPNVVIIFIDDMGYADIGPFGCDAYPTPNLDRMATEGRVFTDFHSATAVCSESRAALLTGCYSKRVSIFGALHPGATVGLHPAEVTLAELCKSRGYATACFGKWHLGDAPEFLPTRQGFDEYFGLLYSNDMWPYLDGEDSLAAGTRKRGDEPYPPLPLYDGEEVVNASLTPADQAQLTTQYTERAVAFIDHHAGERPFFCYVPHTMVHVPIYVSEKFAGKSGAGLYGDVVMELDWSVGRILKALQRGGVADNTLVVFTSDNGPWLTCGDHAGSARPLREGKQTMFEGGYREPCVMRWPGRIPPATACDELCTTMDLLPTIAGLIGAEVPTDRVIDGKDILPLMTDHGERSPHEVMYCYFNGELRGVRDRRWKLHLPHHYPTLAGREGGTGGKKARMDRSQIGTALYDLKADRGETTDVSADHPEVVARLMQHVETARHELGDKLTDREGSAVRPVGRVDPEAAPAATP